MIPLLLLVSAGCHPEAGKENPPEKEDQESRDPWDTSPIDHEPGVAFLDPREGDVFTAIQSIHVDVLAGDELSLEGLSLSWGGTVPGSGWPANPGADGTIDFMVSPLPLGDYELTVEAKDKAGQSGDATVHFSVVTPDADGDGFVNDRLHGDDCDDADPTVFPGATEVCDEVDNDCDGHTDEGVTTRYWIDSDADGYGNPLSLLEACALPAGYSANDQDCDDTHAASYPGNPEICDYLDNDCNGNIDEAVTLPFYQDADADGYGNPAVSVQDCVVPGGYAPDPTDCDDGDPAISPAATEICLDGQDNDCDGTSNQCGLGGTIGLATADATLLGEAASDFAGISVAGGDFDNDGLGDLLVGAFGNDDAGVDAGAVYLVHGPVSGTLSLSNASLQLLGEGAGDQAGYSVASAGDYNGDGKDDMLVGAWANDKNGEDAGVAYLVHGGDSGSLELARADGIFWGKAAGDQAGYSVAAAGDTDGDGYGDILVGGWGSDDGGSLAGAAWLIRGPFSGNLSLDAADAERYGATAGDFAGYSLAGAGDTDADGYDDVVIGGYGATASAGKTWLVRGPISGTSSLVLADATMTGEHSGDASGSSVSSAGDTDGDGNADLLIGAYSYDYSATNSGLAYVIYGPVSGTLSLAAADARLGGEGKDDNAGWSVASAGDMDGDGQDDLLVGAFREDTGGTASGSVYLLYGPPASLMSLSASNAKLYGTDSNGYAGYSVSVVGDTDGDGKADVLVGGPYSDTGGSYLCGTAWLVRGTGL